LVLVVPGVQPQALAEITVQTEIIRKYLVVDLQRESQSAVAVVGTARAQTPVVQVQGVATVPKVARLLQVKEIQEVQGYQTIGLSGSVAVAVVLEKLEPLQVLLRQVQEVQEFPCHGSRHR
jgi:hypothetical protein